MEVQSAEAHARHSLRRHVQASKALRVLGLTNVIKHRMFIDPNWCKLRGAGRVGPSQSFDYMRCQDLEIQRVNEASSGKLTVEGTPASFYNVGIDWGQPFGLKQHSCGYNASR